MNWRRVKVADWLRLLNGLVITCTFLAWLWPPFRSRELVAFFTGACVFRLLDLWMGDLARMKRLEWGSRDEEDDEDP